jgi:hypothetical protein
MQALLIALFLFASVSEATIAVIHDIQTMTKKSHLVIEAKVVSQKVIEDTKGRIITLTTLQVKDGMKGAQAGQELTLYQVGGELNGRVMRLQGASVYRPGERVMLFAQPYHDKIVSYGLGLGKFKINSPKSEFQVTEDIQGLEIMTQEAGRKVITGPSPRKYTTLKAFKDEIRKAL